MKKWKFLIHNMLLEWLRSSMFFVEDKEALYNLTKTRIELSGSFLELLLMIPEEFSKHISIENEEQIKKDLVNNLHSNKFNTYEFEDLKQKYVLIFILRDLKKSLEDYCKEKDTQLVDRIEFFNKEIIAKELNLEEQVLSFFKEDVKWESLNLMTNHWKENYIEILVLKQKRQAIWDLLGKEDTPLVKIAKILL